MHSRAKNLEAADSTGGQAEHFDLNLFALSRAGSGRDGNSCKETKSTSEIARVGPFVSTKIDTNSRCDGAAHASDSHEFKTNDLRHGAEPLSLNDLFKKEDIYKALMSDKLVKHALASVNAEPGNFAELEKLLSGGDGFGIAVYQDRPGKDPLDFNLNNHMFSNFSFHHLEGNRVAIRLLLDYGSEASRNQMTQLGIALPVPEGLKKSLLNASKGVDGFLMKDAEKRGRKRIERRTFKLEN